MSELRKRLESLGLSQYFDVFVAEGFDTWETILDITESDLNALNVKLGHRRKLQRAILETRNQYPDRVFPLSYGKAPSAEGSYRSDDSATESKSLKRHEPTAPSTVTGTTSKRKYRRHPKPDENAPERPPSAYVIFSNQMREELKGQELSFTEIAKVVGERWQILMPEAREVFERQANAAKEKYYAELAEYKKTTQYAEYQEYLKDFKAKHGPLVSVREEGKKVKLEPETSTSTRSSSHDQTERHIAPLSATDGYSGGHRRSGSSPPRSSYGRPVRPPVSKSTSPAQFSFAGLNSPRVEQYSPVTTSPTTTSLAREAPYEYHHPGSYAGPDYAPGPTPTPTLHSYPSTSSTPPSLASFGSQYQNTRELPTRRPYRDASSLPPLTHEDTTMSSATLSSGTSHSSTLPEPRLPAPDPSKAQRLLPAPVPMHNPQQYPFDQRPPSIGQSLQQGPQVSQASQGASGQEIRASSSPLAALLRAGELARDADNPMGEKDIPP